MSSFSFVTGTLGLRTILVSALCTPSCPQPMETFYDLFSCNFKAWSFLGLGIMGYFSYWEPDLFMTFSYSSLNSLFERWKYACRDIILNGAQPPWPGVECLCSTLCSLLWSESGRLGSNFPCVLNGFHLPPKERTQLGSAAGRNYQPTDVRPMAQPTAQVTPHRLPNKPLNLPFFLHVFLAHSEFCTSLSRAPCIVVGHFRVSACAVPSGLGCVSYLPVQISRISSHGFSWSPSSLPWRHLMGFLPPLTHTAPGLAF